MTLVDDDSPRFRTEVHDPLLLEWRAKNTERLRLLDHLKQLNNELRELKVRIATGVCLLCGKQFQRMRPTKLYCSQACLTRAHIARNVTSHRHFDVIAIREHLPMLRLLMTPISIRILENLTQTDSIGRTADSAEVSRQRISQIAGKAGQLILAFRLAQHAQAMTTKESA